jgi:tricorn protease
VLKTPRFREDRFRDLFKDEPPRPPSGERAEAGDTQPPPAPTAPVEIVFDDIRRRFSILLVGLDVNAQRSAPTVAPCC